MTPARRAPDPAGVVQLGLWDVPAPPTPICGPTEPPPYAVGDRVKGRTVLAVWWENGWRYKVGAT